MARKDQAEQEVHTIDAAEFARVVASGHEGVTLVDLREPDEVLVSGIDGALNIPMNQTAARMDSIPKDKPVYLFCRTGDWSAGVAEVLAERGYEVYDLAGGYQAYRAYLQGNASTVPAQGAVAVEVDKVERPPVGSPAAPDVPTQASAVSRSVLGGSAAVRPDARHAASNAVPSGRPDVTSEPVLVDAKGLKCPGPIVKVADVVRGLAEGQEVYVEATEDAFASDIAVWCDRTGNKLESLEVEDGVISALLRKGGGAEASAQRPASDHEKTFVIFSGDLDKTIAAFIMANGGAAMGRQVTMFFTFWGLNVLRRPEKVKVQKNLVERMFGAMMPRGTTKLGLSRMNMFGIGPKMIRWLMREKGISSLEELIDQARAHGVRIVACQMSMEIMGIKKEELIDGVELGGVATMLGSAEKSDLTYFI